MPGSLPEGWCETALGDVAEVIAGQSPPGTTVSDWDGSSTGPGLPFIQGNAEFGARSPSPTKWCIAPAKRAEPGDTLLSVRAPVGETNRADGPLAIGRGIAAVRFRDIEPEFGWHALNHAKRAFERLAQGSTFESIGAEVIKGLTLRIPPLAEQRAIAAVLDAVDDTIERTEAVIAATEELRRALLHELLTRGVPGMHSEWKHVPGLGTVPACWEVTTLGEAGRWLSGGTPSKDREDYWRGEIPWISAKDMKVREIWDATDHISNEGARDGSRVIPAGTILMVVRGMILAHSFPIAITRVPCAFNQDLKAVVSRQDIVPEYLLAALDVRKRRLLDLPTTSTHGTLRVISEELFSIEIPVPPREEQERIAETLQATDAKRDLLISVSEQAFAMKGALAEALLTGAQRVPMAGAVK